MFGQLVEGEVVREAISNTATNSSDRPTNPVVINTATAFNDTENGVVLLKAMGSGTGQPSITVTVTDSEGNSTSQIFQATVVQDTANGAPFLNAIPTVQAPVGVATQVNLTAQDAENDTLIYSVTKLGSENYTVTVDRATGVATVTPAAGFSGQVQFLARRFASRQLRPPPVRMTIKSSPSLWGNRNRLPLGWICCQRAIVGLAVLTTTRRQHP